MGQDDDTDCEHDWRIVTLVVVTGLGDLVPSLSTEERCVRCETVRYAAADAELRGCTGAT